jgi:hypothetical protein
VILAAAVVVVVVVIFEYVNRFSCRSEKHQRELGRNDGSLTLIISFVSMAIFMYFFSSEFTFVSFQEHLPFKKVSCSNIFKRKRREKECF